MITLKSEKEISLMREASGIVVSTHKLLAKHVEPRITTGELDAMAARHIEENGGRSAFLGYMGFPGHICTSINEEVVHGIPGRRKLREGDIISIDVGVSCGGYYGDAAVTLPVGKVSPQLARLIEVTRQSLYNCFQYARKGFRLSDISHAVQSYAEAHDCNVVRNYVGHGIGTLMHEEPQVPNFGRPGRGPRLMKGMTLAIEPMVVLGDWQVEVLEDSWTVVTRDRSASAHFEHTIVIGEGHPEILTEW